MRRLTFIGLLFGVLSCDDATLHVAPEPIDAGFVIMDAMAPSVRAIRVLDVLSHVHEHGRTAAPALITATRSPGRHRCNDRCFANVSPDSQIGPTTC